MIMKISILCTDPYHPVLKILDQWVKGMTLKNHDISLFFDKADLIGGDILFLISCNQTIGSYELKKYTSSLVLHASDLPKRRGWSPHIWSILDGESEITVSLLEAAASIDTGPIWLKECFQLDGHELFDEINQKLFDVEMHLMTQAVENFRNIQPITQAETVENYMRKRTPADSRINPEKSILDQFNLLRVADPSRYPAYFDYKGYRYLIKIEKEKNG